MKLTQTTGPALGGQKPKWKRIQPSSLGNVDLKHYKLKIIIKRQRNAKQMKEQIRNTEAQINKWRRNRQTTCKRIRNNDSKDDQKPWKKNEENAKIN